MGDETRVVPTVAVLNYCAVLKPYSVSIFFASSEFFSHSLNSSRFRGRAGSLAERRGVFVAFHIGQLDGAEVDTLLLGGGEVGGVDEARIGVTGGDLGGYCAGDLAFGGCVLEGDVVLLQFLRRWCRRGRLW